jgi:carboxymethylenebutenolidase
MNQFQEYFVHEFVEEYRVGHMSRRDMMRRVLYISGGVASTAALLGSLGVPSIASAQPAAAPIAAPASESPLSVAPDDPAVSTQWISFPNSMDGATIMAYEARPSQASGALPVVLVCMRNQGVEPQIQDVARRWAKLGYIGVAVDLLSREGGTNALDKAQIPALLSKADPNRHVSDFQAAADYYSTQSDADATRLGMNGFCFGGGIVWRSAEAIQTMKAAVPFYGAPPPLDQVPNIQAAVLGVYSADPNDFANNNRDGLDAALSAAGITHRMNVYPDTHHDFYNDTGQAYNEAQALAAWNDAVTWMQMYV